MRGVVSNRAAHFLNCAEKGVSYAQKIQQKSYCGISHTVLGSDFARCVRDNMYGAEFDFLILFQIGLIVFYKPIRNRRQGTRYCRAY